jgi:hypothetical protein
MESTAMYRSRPGIRRNGASTYAAGNPPTKTIGDAPMMRDTSPGAAGATLPEGASVRSSTKRRW